MPGNDNFCLPDDAVAQHLLPFLPVGQAVEIATQQSPLLTPATPDLRYIVPRTGLLPEAYCQLAGVPNELISLAAQIHAALTAGNGKLRFHFQYSDLPDEQKNQVRGSRGINPGEINLARIIRSELTTLSRSQPITIEAILSVLLNPETRTNISDALHQAFQSSVRAFTDQCQRQIKFMTLFFFVATSVVETGIYAALKLVYAISMVQLIYVFPATCALVAIISYIAHRCSPTEELWKNTFKSLSESEQKASQLVSDLIQALQEPLPPEDTAYAQALHESTVIRIPEKEAQEPISSAAATVDDDAPQHTVINIPEEDGYGTAGNGAAPAASSSWFSSIIGFFGRNRAPETSQQNTAATPLLKPSASPS